MGELDLENEGRRAAVEVEDVSTGFGMNLQDLTAETARQLDLPRGTQGPVVSGVEPGGPAQAGGVRPGDVITSVNRVPVATAADAIRSLNRSRRATWRSSSINRGGRAERGRITRE